MSKVTFKEEASAPATPGAGYVTFYAKTDGKLYFKDDTGTEYPVKPTGGGTGDLLSDGSVALTADWDVGAFKITANQFESDVADGTAPLIVTSKTQVDNLTSEWASKALAVVEPCRNESGGTLSKGTPVYISGYSVGQDLILVAAADSDAAATMPCIGLIAADIANNADGYVVIEGNVNGVDTSGYTIGDELYVSGTAGTLTDTRPTGTGLVQEVAIVLRVHATLGVLQVIPGAEVEGLPNLAENYAWVGNASGVPTATDAAGLRTLLNVEDGATADQSDAEIETAYNNQVAAASQVEMEAGTETAIRRMTPERVAQAIAALAPSGAVEFADSDWRVTGSVDATKKVAFEVDGLTTGTTRTITMPDTDVDLGNLTDSNAIHDNASGEIAGLTEKASPVSADVLIIEDSAASNAKKKVQIGNLPGGGGGVMSLIGTATVAGSAATTLTLGSLDLSSYAAFKVLVQVKNATASNSNLSLFYNADTTATNYYHNVLFVGGASVVGGTAANTGLVGRVRASDYAEMQIDISTDLAGRARAMARLYGGLTTNIELSEYSHYWTTVANVTSITLSASVASSLDVGTTFSVYGIT